MRDRTMFILSIGVMAAILAAIVGDYIVAAMETQTTLGGVIGILGGYFGSKGASKGNCDSSCQNKTE
jgi:hypothetical protein